MSPSVSTLVGQRVKLVFTDDRYTKLHPGSEGVVFYVDDLGTVMVDWEDGSTLGLIPSIDSWTVIEES
jgi:hypothetical protein